MGSFEGHRWASDGFVAHLHLIFSDCYGDEALYCDLAWDGVGSLFES